MKVGTWVAEGILQSGIEFEAERSNTGMKVTVTNNRLFQKYFSFPDDNLSQR